MHLLPAKRLTPENILRTIEAGTASYHVLLEARGIKINEDGGRIDRLVARYKEIRGSAFEKKIAAARKRAIKHARNLILKEARTA
jgi:hypothetical protein